MKQDRGTGHRGIWRVLQAGICALAATFGAQAAQAQSAYDCRNLETFAPFPAVEGKEGMFFSIRPELQSHHSISDPSIRLLTQLQAALAARGTTLVLLPVPTRAQVLGHFLPPMAAHLGYDASMSTAVHEEMVARMTSAGLTVADPLSALRAAARNGARPFFQADPRPTAYGMQLLAKSVAAALDRLPSTQFFERGVFTSRAGAQVTLTSSMRLLLQTACQGELPQVVTRSYVTARDENAPQPVEGTQSTMVVLGTDITSTTALNLPGFLSEETGLKALSYGLKEGGAFAAMTSYMTSEVFDTTRPDVLVWELPVHLSLAAHGDQPLRELIYAAKGSCEPGVSVTPSAQGDRLSAKLGQVPLGTDQALFLDAGDVALPYAKFHFTGRDGVVRTRSIYRNPAQILTGRFYLPLSTLVREDISSVSIEGAARFGADAQLMLCS